MAAIGDYIATALSEADLLYSVYATPTPWRKGLKLSVKYEGEPGGFDVRHIYVKPSDAFWPVVQGLKAGMMIYIYERQVVKNGVKQGKWEVTGIRQHHYTVPILKRLS